MELIALDDETGRLLLANDPSFKSVRVSATTSSENVSALCHSTHIERLDVDLQVFRPSYQRLINGDIENLSGTVLGQFSEWLERTCTLNDLHTVWYGAHVATSNWWSSGALSCA
jgi:hypothetical protein